MHLTSSLDWLFLHFVSLCLFPDYLKHLFRERLLIDPKEHPMLLAEPSSNSAQQRERCSYSLHQLLNLEVVSLLWIIMNLLNPHFRHSCTFNNFKYNIFPNCVNYHLWRDHTSSMIWEFNSLIWNFMMKYGSYAILFMFVMTLRFQCLNVKYSSLPPSLSQDNWNNLFRNKSKKFTSGKSNMGIRSRSERKSLVNYGWSRKTRKILLIRSGNRMYARKTKILNRP